MSSFILLTEKTVAQGTAQQNKKKTHGGVIQKAKFVLLILLLTLMLNSKAFKVKKKYKQERQKGGPSI